MQSEPRTAIHPRGGEIQFHPGPHHYLLNGQELTSVTSLIRRWFPEFDAEAVAKRKAEREGGDYQALLSEWSRKRDAAAAFGSKAHLMADRILQEKNSAAADALAESPRERAYLAAIKEALERMALGYDVIESEKIVFSPDLRVAGTVDLLLRSRSTGEYVVADWKTNRQIEFRGFGQEKGFGPCANLAHCNFIHYSLQISAYGELLTKEGYIPSDNGVRGVLLHLSEKSDGRVICEYVKTKDLMSVARAIMTDPQRRNDW